MQNLGIRERTEYFEEQILSPYATLSRKSKGRARPEPEDEIRTIFQRDRDRIIHSKAFRRLKHKTQVFVLPEGDHYRTRLTHTLEVSQISRTIVKALRLNEDLIEAIAMGHDLGHTPFGHAGEEALNQIYRDGFHHNEQSLRVVELLENDGRGLNLSWEVRDGILHHTGKVPPATLEGKVIKIADRIAYLNHDIDDSIRAGILNVDDLPKQVVEVLGYTHSERIATLVKDIIISSQGKNEIIQSPEILEAMNELRQFMFRTIYLNKPAQEEEEKGKEMVRYIFEYFLDKPNQLEYYYDTPLPDSPIDEQIKDFIAGMTDRYIVSLFQQLMIPKPFAHFSSGGVKLS